jgi:hypothetical protein
MPELNENDLRKLFQTAGHHTPRHDLTARIMAQVAVTPMVRIDIAKPLISKKAWWCAGVGLAALAGASVLLPGDTNAADGPVSIVLATLEERISQVRLPAGSWPMWTGLTLGGLLLLTWIDGTLMRSMRRSID